jgi:hypothetical protein
LVAGTVSPCADGASSTRCGKHAHGKLDVATARRNLAQRIERFLAARRETILTAGEATNITAALAFLESGRYPKGEDAMMLAEKGWPSRGEFGTATALEVLAELLADLVRL